MNTDETYKNGPFRNYDRFRIFVTCSHDPQPEAATPQAKPLKPVTPPNNPQHPIWPTSVTTPHMSTVPKTLPTALDNAIPDLPLTEINQGGLPR